MHIKKVFLIQLLVVLILAISIIFIKKQSTKTTVKNNSYGYKKNEVFNKVGCNRKTRINNLPQYDRALSLIQQRLLVNQKRFKYNNRALFIYFPPNLTNCVKIIEKNSAEVDDFEGYFTFNSEDIKNNYYPIIVNSKYVKADDVLIALLLTHEITHIQQYIDSVNKINTFTCIEKEVNAFLASRQFYISGLNEEEMNTVTLRIYDAVDNNKNIETTQKFNKPFDGQLLMIETIQNLYSSPNSKCKKVENPTIDEASWDEFGDYLDCIDKEVPFLLKKIIENDSYYQKQCKI